jgi:FAD/FMN-containing dehydrogenase
MITGVSAWTRSAATADPSAAAYRAAVAGLQDELGALPAGEPVRLRKRTSNLFRVRRRAGGSALDVDAFAGVLSIDPDARSADVLGMTTYRDLVTATLPHGLAPLVVPQLGTITLGGAVAGLGIESTSFRAGYPHESVLEMDVLTGDGRVVTARRDNEHADLFIGFPNSYGSLGYALRLTIALEPVAPYVRLRHLRFSDPEPAADALASITRTRTWQGEPVDYLDAVALAPDRVVVVLGCGVPSAPYTSDYTGTKVFWRSLAERSEDYLSIHDYLWRWDTDWFWCSRGLGVQHPAIRPLVPRALKRSEGYWAAIAALRRSRAIDAYDRLRGRQREFVIQDVEIPVGRLPEFLARFDAEVGMRPVWLCPIRQHDPGVRWTLFSLDPHTTYVNVGFWGSVDVPVGTPAGTLNRRVEALVTECAGHKSLYSDSFYSREEFARLYGGEDYAELKARYDPGSRLPDMYDKCVAAR